MVAAAAIVLGATSASAQPYVAGSVNADIVRTGSSGDLELPGSGEALGFSLRAGAALTHGLGVELDFTRPARIDQNQRPDVGILSGLDYSFLSLDGLSVPVTAIAGYEVHSAQRTTTITAALTARQDVTPRFAMVYLGGIAFARIDRTVSTRFNYQGLLRAIYPPSYDVDSVEYTQGPMAGIEGRVGLSDHTVLVPGLRLLAVGGGWIMRPAVGLAWTF